MSQHFFLKKALENKNITFVTTIRGVGSSSSSSSKTFFSTRRKKTKKGIFLRGWSQKKKSKILTFKLKMFKAFSELKELDLCLQTYCEVSRAITKHAANYEAKEMTKEVEKLVKTLSENEKADSVTIKILHLQTNILTGVTNFLIDILGEENDTLRDEEPYSPATNFAKPAKEVLANSLVLGCHILDLLHKYQANHFDNLFDVSSLQSLHYQIEEIADRGRKSDLFLLTDAEIMTNVMNAVIRRVIVYTKFAVKIDVKK